METQTQPVQHRPITLRRVLWSKFLRWVNDSKLSTLSRSFLRLSLLLVVLATIWDHVTMLELLRRAVTTPKVVACIGVVILWLHGKSFLRLTRKKIRKGNQHTYYGVPVSELATYLLEQKAFPVDAQKALGLSQPVWRKMASELEVNRILVRGENNSRVLNKITREELVTQLRDKFPLVLCDGEWASKNGPWRTWLKDKEREEQGNEQTKRNLQKREERIRKKKRELEAIESRNELHPAFMRRELAITV